MCGINGIYHYKASCRVDRQVVRRTSDFMARRGPDDSGEWYSADAALGLAHRRLSIIDLSERGAQPMISKDGEIVVTFNGEIYNYRALRQDLENEGCVFQSQTDTEVLIHLYRRKSTRMVTALRGMFAFALWDAKQRRLFLARDPYGIKPLYYADDGRTIQFASSVKALLSGGKISREPDPAGVVGFYLFGSVPEPFTTLRAIRAVPAGSTMIVDCNGARAPESYFSIAGVYKVTETKIEVVSGLDIQKKVRAALLDSVKHHLVADVPVGAFLSAGIDSSALVGLMRDAGQQEIKSVTLSFSEFAGTHADEAPYAKRVAKHYATDHVTRQVGTEEFQHDLPAIMEAMDQPSIDGINTWFVSKAARELGLKVAITGLGGDELFGGYSTFKSIPRYAGIKAPGLGALLKLAVSTARSVGIRIHPKAAGLLDYGGSFSRAYLLQRGLFLPSELHSVLEDDGMVREGLLKLDPTSRIDAELSDGPRSAFGKVATLESSFYLRNQLLRDTDWASMAHSLEVRTPFVDHKLLSEITPLTCHLSRPSEGKALVAMAPSKPVPNEIINRIKTGFGIPVRSLLGKSDTAKGDGGKLWNRTWACRVMAAQARKQGLRITREIGVR